MKFVYSLFVLFILGLSGSVWGQADPYPVKDCIGKDGNPEIYKISKMKEGDELKGVWEDTITGTPGDSMNWASSFFKHPRLATTYAPTKPKEFKKLKNGRRQLVEIILRMAFNTMINIQLVLIYPRTKGLEKLFFRQLH